MHLTKKNNSSLDFIIVGQGIAGSILAIKLIEAGYNILVIDNPNLSSSSKVAAGIWNPVVFKRLTKSWLADDLIPELHSFYSYCETLLKTPLIHKRNIIKPFTEEQEKNLWLKKSQTENLFLDNNTYESLRIEKNYTIPSYSKVLHAGNLDMTIFLNSTRDYLKSNNSYLEETFEYSNVNHTENYIEYKTINAKNIIFCDGHLISKNPYFNWIPMKPAKGETFTIHCPELHLKNDIFNKGFFIMPLGDDLFKVGATYEWGLLNDEPSDKGKEELIKKLNSILSVPYTIIKHEAGVRPSVIDRRPVVGNHPTHKNIFIFNGLGTKGVMLAPYFAKQLIALIQLQTAIDMEVSPARFFKY